MDIQQYLSFEFYRNLIRGASSNRTGRSILIGVGGVVAHISSPVAVGIGAVAAVG